MNTKTIARTGALLAICIVFQLFKGVSVYITGPAVNAVIIIAVLSAGFLSGTIIAVIAPLVAFLVGATPILQMIPLMLPVIMFGNWLMAVGAYYYKKNSSVLSLIAGSAVKAAFLWLTVWYVMLPLFGQNVPDPAKAAMKMTFSVTQLVTALIGSALAVMIWKLIKNTALLRS